MSTAFAPRTTMQRTTSPASTSSRCAALHSSMLPSPAALRRTAPTSAKSRSSCVVPFAFRDQGFNAWGGRNFNKRGAWGPLLWQVGGPMTGAVLEELAREFSYAANNQARGQRKGNGCADAWSEAAFQGSLPLDFEEQEAEYVITADVPGLQKSDLKITVSPKDRSLTVSGERQRPGTPSADQDEEQRFKRRFERRMGKFQRKLPSLPEDADLEAVSARVTHGVLTITLKKTQKPFSDVVDINID